MQQANKRQKVIAMLGSTSPDLNTVACLLGQDLTARFGGAFLSMGQGYWSSRGNEFIDNYPIDTVVEEASLRIELLVMVEQAETAKQFLKNRCQHYNHQYQLGCNYLHIEMLAAEAHHVAIT